MHCRSNIILDFMDPENRILYGSYKNLSEAEHVRLLKEGLNLATFICDDFCILPPCAIMQCRIARRALMENPYYFEEGIIKFPLRENSLDLFFAKKKKNYALDETDDDYSDFFAEDGPLFLKNHATEIIKRETKIGQAIAAMIEATPFDNPLWSNLRENYPLSILEDIQSAPRELIDHDEAISVKAIKRLRKLENYPDIDFQIGRILQNKYFYAYIYEYSAKIINEIPPKTTDFLIEHFGSAYEYSYWKFVLKSLGLLNFILKSGSKIIVDLRDLHGSYDFVDSAMMLAETTADLHQAKQLVSEVIKDMRQKSDKSLWKKFEPLSDENDLLDFEDEISELFLLFSESSKKILEGQRTRKSSSTKLDTKNVSNTFAVDQMKLQLANCDYSKPFLFVGYQRQDMEELVYKDCIMLGKMGINYWIDNANMYGCDQYSEGWKTVIYNALSKCNLYIPYISEGFFESVPCCEEVKNFFDRNSSASILVLLQEGFTADMVIQKILTYDNILQGEDANNMIRLFKAKASISKQSSYTIDQIYRFCNSGGFQHYIVDPIFYNSFVQCGLVDTERFPNYQSWLNYGMQLLKENN